MIHLQPLRQVRSGNPRAIAGAFSIVLLLVGFFVYDTQGTSASFDVHFYGVLSFFVVCALFAGCFLSLLANKLD